MSKISRIRILNLNYNNNTIKIDDETFASFAPVIHLCDVQKMCKSVQSQNQPRKNCVLEQPDKPDFRDFQNVRNPNFIQTTISHDTSVLWHGLGHPNRHRFT